MARTIPADDDDADPVQVTIHATTNALASHTGMRIEPHENDKPGGRIWMSNREPQVLTAFAWISDGSADGQVMMTETTRAASVLNAEFGDRRRSRRWTDEAWRQRMAALARAHVMWSTTYQQVVMEPGLRRDGHPRSLIEEAVPREGERKAPRTRRPE